jgi:hypothetical protein
VRPGQALQQPALRADAVNIDAVRRRRFERELATLLSGHGAEDHAELTAAITRAFEQMVEALAASSEDGASLTALDVVRVRTNKFAATRVPPAVFRDVPRLAALRAEILKLARDFLGEEATRFSRFGRLPGR